MDEDRGSRIGTVSLWASLVGLVAAVAALLLAWLGGDGLRPYYVAGFFVFVGAEVIALIAGSIDRQSHAGRAGLRVSSVSLAVVGVALLFVTPVRRVIGG